MKRKIVVDELYRFLSRQKPEIRGSRLRAVGNVAAIGKGGKDSLSFCSSHAKNPLALISGSGSGVIICPDLSELPKNGYRGKTLIIVKNPRLAFIRAIGFYFSAKPRYGIHPTAVINPRAKIHPDVFIGPHVCVGECEIGKGTVIYDNVSIGSGVRVGKRVTIHSGTVIGADGFGYERSLRGRLEKFPHFGGVVIGDDVEIGSNTSIDRGVLDDTIVGKGTKVDNLVHIAHNVVIGRHCAVIAHAMIGGSVRVGDYAWIAPSACIRDTVTIGKRAVVGLGAVVTKDVADGVTVMGCPAKPAREYKKILKTIDRLIELSVE